MSLNNKTYDILKWVVLVLMPALAVFLQGIGELYQWVDAEVYVTTMNLFAVFMGTILQISSHNYRNGGGGNGNGPIAA